MYYSVLIGIINNIIWTLYMSGALFSLGIRKIVAPITHFLHRYCYWYFDFKIAHTLSLFAICFATILLVKKKIKVWLFIISLILNIIWMIIYMLAYMN